MTIYHIHEHLPSSRRADPVELDAHELTIASLLAAMQADFGKAFLSQFAGSSQRDMEDTIALYKARLTEKLRIYSTEAIINGYEACLDSRPDWPPTLPVLAKYVADESRKLNVRQDLEKRVKLLDATLEKPVKKRVFPDLSKLLDPNRKFSDSATRAELVKEHEALINAHLAKQPLRQASTQHACAVPGCSDYGVLSSGTKGETGLFCRLHHDRLKETAA